MAPDPTLGAPPPAPPVPPAPPKMTAPLPAAIPSAAVTLIETGGTGAGAPIPSGTTIITPDHQPNLVVNVVSPLMAIAVRFANQFLTTLVGLVTAGMTPAGGHLLYTSDFYHLVLTCASLSVAGAGLGAIKDLVTIFGKLEGKYPLLSGSV